MSDDRKYRQRGYQDSGGPPESRRGAPGPPREKKEGPRGRGLGAPTESVFRCAACGEQRLLAEDLGPATVCSRCGAPLHSCANCASFDTSARWECRRAEELPARIAKKRDANECAVFSAKVSLERGREAAQPAPGDARAAFDALFKL